MPGEVHGGVTGTVTVGCNVFTWTCSRSGGESGGNRVELAEVVMERAEEGQEGAVAVPEVVPAKKGGAGPNAGGMGGRKG